jgi:ATP-dependent DNA helicase RecQ
MATPKAATGPTALPCDEALFASLRSLRKQLADQRDVPAYVIFGDVALRQMAREYPTDATAFRRINGVGEKKLAELGDVFMRAISEHVEVHGKRPLDQLAERASQR